MAHHYPAILVAHGSFNPVHKHHLEMMVHARRRLEEAGYSVLRGFVAITNADRLSSKGAEAVTDEHRLAALKLGCDAVSGDWLTPEPRGVNFGSGRQVAKGLSVELLAEEPNATIFTVVGADTAVRYTGETKGPTVVIGRNGSTEAVREALQGLGTWRKWDLFLAEELPGEECSSTKLRQALQINDWAAVKNMCPAPVAEYLWLHRRELYGRCSAASAPVDGSCSAPAAVPGASSCTGAIAEVQEVNMEPASVNAAALGKRFRETCW